MAIIVIGLYAWQILSGQPFITWPFTVDFISTIIATITIIFCLIGLLIKVSEHNLALSLISYILTGCLVTSLMVQSDSLISPFVALWAIVVLFSYRFGGLITVLIALVTSALIAVELLQNDLTIELIITALAIGPICLIISLIIWHKSEDLAEAYKVTKQPVYLANNKIKEFANEAGTIINSIGDGLIAIDSQGIIKLINPSAQNITGWPAQEAISLNYKSVIKLLNKDGSDLAETNNPIDKALNYNQQLRDNSLGLLTKGNKKLLISLVVSPIGEAGSGVIIVIRDITKEKAEEREQAEFISTASHEMRTPVASIEGYIGLAMNPQTAQIDIRARDYLIKAHQSAQHLGQLFQDLLDISKADDGRISNNPVIINLVPFLESIVQNFQAKAKEKNIRLIYQPKENDLNTKNIVPRYSVNLDAGHLREIIDNLIDNAIKYTTQNGEVTINIEAVGDQVMISVKDSGIGISTEDIPHLFQKFYRIDNKDTREIGGTGLGLYLCRRLTEIMGGRIWVKSSLGNGTTFFVQFHRLSEEQAELLLKQAASQPKTINPETVNKKLVDVIKPSPTPQSQLDQQPITNPMPTNNAPTQVISPISTTPINQRPANINQVYRNSRTQGFNIPSR